jgi:hypothetical protein
MNRLVKTAWRTSQDAPFIGMPVIRQQPAVNGFWLINISGVKFAGTARSH